ncbi:MAG: hypothetical protein AAFV95_25610 [Bacteroidota bacterium]
MKYLLNCRDVLLVQEESLITIVMVLCSLILYSISQATNQFLSFDMVTSITPLIPFLLERISRRFVDVEYPSNTKLLKPVPSSQKLSSMLPIDRYLHIVWYICAILGFVGFAFAKRLNAAYLQSIFVPSIIGFVLLGLLINRQGFRKIDHRLVKGIALLPGELLINTYEKQVRFQIDQLVSEYLSDDILKFVHKNPNGQYEQLEVNVRKLSTKDREKLDLALRQGKEEALQRMELQKPPLTHQKN